MGKREIVVAPLRATNPMNFFQISVSISFEIVAFKLVFENAGCICSSLLDLDLICSPNII